MFQLFVFPLRKILIHTSVMRRLFSDFPLLNASCRRSLLLLLLLLLVGPLALHAQTMRHITGSVTDEVGEVLAGADIYTAALSGE